jgi:chromosome segregation ATPase
VSTFYRIELARAISDIRQDFEVLSQSQANELEDYYRVKTEQVQQEIASEDERKRLLNSEGAVNSMDTLALSSSVKDNHSDLLSLKADNQQLQGHLDAITDDLEKIQEERLREQQAYEQELNQFRQQIADTQAGIDGVLESNVSLRFEMSTYRRLLDVEEKHLNRMEQTPATLSTVSSSGVGALASSSFAHKPQSAASNPISNELGTKKMTVQKTARGRKRINC